MSDIRKIFADNLRKFRKAKGLTQEELAELIGVTVIAIQGWESQRNWPEIKNIMELSKTLQIEDYKLFEKTPPPSVESLAQIVLNQAKEIKRFESIQPEILEALSKAPPRKVEMIRVALGLPVVLSSRRHEKKA